MLGYTRDFTQDGAPQAFIYDASRHYIDAGIPLVVLGVGAGWGYSLVLPGPGTSPRWLP